MSLVEKWEYFKSNFSINGEKCIWGKVKDPMFKPNYSSTIYAFCRLSIVRSTAGLIIKISLVLAPNIGEGQYWTVLTCFTFILTLNLINLLLDCPVFLMREPEAQRGETTWLVINGFEPRSFSLWNLTRTHTAFLKDRNKYSQSKMMVARWMLWQSANTVQKEEKFCLLTRDQ